MGGGEDEVGQGLTAEKFRLAGEEGGGWSSVSGASDLEVGSAGWKDSSLVPAVWLRDGGAASVSGGGIVREQIGRHWRVVRSLCQDARGSECLEDTAT